MPNVLTSLDILEVSLVDHPACATETEYGRTIPRATVAIFKRDLTAGKETKKMKFEAILKSCRSRSEVVAAVEGQAERIAKREGVGITAATILAWDAEAIRAYENCPKPVVKRSVGPRMFKATAAELELHSRAKKRMRKTGESYPHAVSSELQADPSLYDSYEKEIRAGSTTYETPEFMDIPASDLTRILNKGRQLVADDEEDDDEDDDLEKCDACGEDSDPGDKFCSECGADLSDTEKRKRQNTRKGGPGGVNLRGRGARA